MNDKYNAILNEARVVAALERIAGSLEQQTEICSSIERLNRAMLENQLFIQETAQPRPRNKPRHEGCPPSSLQD